MEICDRRVSVMTPICGPKIAGFYVLAGTGELGLYDADGQFHVDATLTAAFQRHNRDFIGNYLKDPREEFRLAIIFGASDRKPQEPLAMLFEESVVRQLYPVGGPVNQGLTAFQRKNRQKHAPQGLQLLLGYHRDSASTLATFCPVLFDRRTSLSGYAERFGYTVTAADANTAVLEVINLLATLPADQRATPETLALRERVAKGVASEEAEPLAAQSLTKAPDSWQPDAPDVISFSNIDKDRRRHHGLNLATERLAQLHRTQRLDQVERWLEVPYRPVDMSSLRRFVQFRNLDDIDVAELASRIFVYTAPSGAHLLDCGQVDSWNMYLLQGMVSLQAEDGATHFVEGETGKAAFPVAFLKPRKYAVTAVTPVSFLWVHDELLQSLAEHYVDQKTRLGLAGR
jgi:hypothetical protein